ncbi:hypothetical protein CAL14_05225 [Bordetella genomosp. 9]|uniref:hypothetical protein n=1 Tax=Bordetella genomosp. 9 TaxID=1416803 RepID=UPI000A296067|nr:hypothetical protein [Bordetella genomosp. 9]ARP89761.1 hypothetical protein CAL14_05225 [Bordetella genomosp. 9]
MPFRPPLTLTELTRIRARYEITPNRAPCAYQDVIVWKDVVALLYEIKRLRAMLLRADQLRDRFPKPNNCLDEVWAQFLADLAAEPCVLEQSEIKDELTAPTKRRTKRKA